MLSSPLSRRTLLKLAAAASLNPTHIFASFPNPPVTQVLVVFKCHLDVGFTDTQAKVLRRYFDVFYPAAIGRATQLRESGQDRYTWTTGSWLLYEYLEQATPVQRRAMEQAVAAGDIAYHALPFSWQSEMLDPTMVTGALGFAADLDRRFARRTLAAKMTDVPGHTRGLIAPLHAAGIRLLDIGVNAASFPPTVPDIFLWSNIAGQDLLVVYHRHDYGSTLQVPGAPLALSVHVRNDNSGPHTLEEIAAIYARLRTQFPGATIRAASLTDVALALQPHRATLPIVTQEIGDTWIYGIPSDPTKVARYREIARLRQEWLARNAFAPGDATDRQLLRRLLLSVEHTWGTDTKTYLDTQHYRPADLAAVLTQPGYQTMLTSWQEKRDDLTTALATLPPPLQAEATTRLAQLTPQLPPREGLTPFNPAHPLETPHFTLALDPTTGAITTLLAKATRQPWATPANPLALFTYQTLSAADFTAYMDRYIQIKADWAPRDFGKPGIETLGATSQSWHPKLLAASHAATPEGHTLHLHLSIDDPPAQSTGNVAWPADLHLTLTLPDARPELHLTLTTLGKPANRLPEAMWLTFAPPSLDPARSTLHKSGETIPFLDVVPGGSRTMHAVQDHLTLTNRTAHALQLTTLDAPIVALGLRSPINFSTQQPDLAQGVHISLFNNAWGTNYLQWASGDWAFRFILST